MHLCWLGRLDEAWQARIGAFENDERRRASSPSCVSVGGESSRMELRGPVARVPRVPCLHIRAGDRSPAAAIMSCLLVAVVRRGHPRRRRLSTTPMPNDSSTKLVRSPTALPTRPYPEPRLTADVQFAEGGSDAAEGNRGEAMELLNAAIAHYNRHRARGLSARVLFGARAGRTTTRRPPAGAERDLE